MEYLWVSDDEQVRKGETAVLSPGPSKEWNEGYVYHGDSDKVFRDFFGGDNPFAGTMISAHRDVYGSMEGLLVSRILR